MKIFNTCKVAQKCKSWVQTHFTFQIHFYKQLVFTNNNLMLTFSSPSFAHFSKCKWVGWLYTCIWGFNMCENNMTSYACIKCHCRWFKRISHIQIDLKFAKKKVEYSGNYPRHYHFTCASDRCVVQVLIREMPANKTRKYK